MSFKVGYQVIITNDLDGNYVFNKYIGTIATIIANNHNGKMVLLLHDGTKSSWEPIKEFELVKGGESAYDL